MKKIIEEKEDTNVIEIRNKIRKKNKEINRNKYIIKKTITIFLVFSSVFIFLRYSFFKEEIYEELMEMLFLLFHVMIAMI